MPAKDLRFTNCLHRTVIGLRGPHEHPSKGTGLIPVQPTRDTLWWGVSEKARGPDTQVLPPTWVAPRRACSAVLSPTLPDSKRRVRTGKFHPGEVPMHASGRHWIRYPSWDRIAISPMVRAIVGPGNPLTGSGESLVGSNLAFSQYGYPGYPASLTVRPYGPFASGWKSLQEGCRTP